MWRRLVASHLKTLAAAAAAAASTSGGSAAFSSSVSRFLISPAPLSSILTRHFSVETSVKKTVEDVLPIATGHEREEIQAELEGREVLDTNNFVGPFGTKEAPAVIKAYYDERIVGCSGGEGEDEHDVVWFKLEKGKPHECPVCQQHFVLEVVGPGGSPYGHDDEEDDHH